MAETTQYFEAVTGARAIAQWDEQAGMEGTTTVSLETQADLVEEDYLSFVQDHTAQFIRMLRWLNREDQELLLSYYFLSKTQTTLAIIHKSTQTICSFRLRMAMKKLGTFMMFGGPPSVEQMDVILRQAGMEFVTVGTCERYSTGNPSRHPIRDKEMRLSKLIDAYEKTRNFQRVAEAFNVHRPDVRRTMSRASKQMMEAPEPEQRAVAAYIHGLLDKASAAGQGYSKRKLAKCVNIYRTDSSRLGDFCWNAADIEHVLIARANH